MYFFQCSFINKSPLCLNFSAIVYYIHSYEGVILALTVGSGNILCRTPLPRCTCNKLCPPSTVIACWAEVSLVWQHRNEGTASCTVVTAKITSCFEMGALLRRMLPLCALNRSLSMLSLCLCLSVMWKFFQPSISQQDIAAH